MPFFGRKKKVDDDDDVVEEIIRRAPLPPEQAPQDNPEAESSHEDAPLERLTAFEVYDSSKHHWKTAGHLNESRRDFAAVVDPTSGKIYAFGGTSADKSASRTAEVYNPHTNSWTYLPEMPDRKRCCHALQVGQRIHVFETGKRTLTYDILSNSWSHDEPDDSFIPKCPPNGKICASAAFASTDKLASGATLVVYGYPVREMDGRQADRWMVTLIGNRRSKSWTVLPPADEFMYYRVVVANGKLVICAGNGMIAFQIVEEGELDDVSTVAGSLTASEKGSWRSAGSGGKLSSITKRSFGKSSRADTHSTSGSGTDRVVEPIKDDGTWKLQPEITSKPPDFRGYACCSVKNNVYISGGCSGDGTIYRSFLSYDVSTQKWKKLHGMTHRRLGHRMAVTNDGKYIFVLGGGDGKSLRSMGVDIYDVEREVWTAAAAMNNYRVFFGFTVCEDKIYVFGGVGNNNGNQLASVEVFDPKTNGWEFAESMPEPRGVCNVITVGKIIYVFGLPSQKVLAYDTVTKKWLDEVPPEANLPVCPPGGCVCASSSFEGGECLVLKYPLEGPQATHRRTANVYDAAKDSWVAVHLLDTFACYSAIVAGEKLVVVTPQNKLQACTILKE